MSHPYAMDQRISVITIAANDLVAMKEFYENVLDWTPVAENKDIIFYKLNGFLLSICKRSDLSSFIGVDLPGKSSITFGYNVSSREQVLELYDQLRTKVKIIKKPTEPPFGGLFFYFADVEDNIIEVAHNTFVDLDATNNAVGHKPIHHL